MKVKLKGETDAAKIRQIQQRYGLDLLTATVLYRRGCVTGDDMLYVLESDIVYQRSPFEAEDIETIIERLTQAIEEDEPVLVFGDRDVDGVTSTAIMVRYLRSRGMTRLSYRIPVGDEPYGLTMDSVSEITGKGITLVITVDCGITCVEEVAELRRQGVDTIILDHHLAGETLPAALAVFDPKVLGSGYPFPSLAGCGVCAKTVWAMEFSRTPLYGEECLVLHAEPKNGTIRINAARLENLLETDRITEEVVEGELSPSRSRLMAFLAVNLPVFVLDSDTELNMLRKAFGRKVDISLIDIRANLEKVMPKARGRSLFDLSVMSRAALYKDGDREMETLISLFRSMSIYSCPSLTSGFEEILQLAAIGTVADLMPMKDENRIIVKRGLRSLSQKPQACLAPLLGRQNLASKNLNARDVSFYIAPVLNAAGRMGNAYAALSLLLSGTMEEAEGYTETLLEMNRKRQRSEENALEAVRGLGFESFERTGGKMVIISDKTIPRGLTGAIANKLLKEYGVPAIVLSEGEDRVSGSMRSSDSLDSRGFLSMFSSLFDDYGGHSKAAGFSLSPGNAKLFVQQAEGYASSMEETSAETTEMIIDADIPEAFMTESLWRLSDLLEPFGQENERVRFYIRGAEITDLRPVSSSRMLSFGLRFGRYSWPCVWWDPHNKESFRKGTKVDMVFSPEVNWYKGNEKRQLLVADMTLSLSR